MQWPSRSKLFTELSNRLTKFSAEDTPLLGAPDSHSRNALAMQMVASIRRLDFTDALKKRDHHPDRANPLSGMFDPERAALHYARSGNFDEAIWLVFLSIHFGKHGKHGWRMLRDVYSGMGETTWTWRKVSTDPTKFRHWLEANGGGIGGAFGNHRKYETLSTTSKNGTATVIESFAHLCSPSPSAYFASLARASGNDPTRIFDVAYNNLKIARFGRLARFDFLALLGRMGLAPLMPGSAYLKGATGPLRGARLLVDGNINSGTDPDALDEILQRLGRALGVGMQVMEDSICNWQKSPKKFIHFRG